MDKLLEYGLRERIRVICSGKIINPAGVAHYTHNLMHEVDLPKASLHRVLTETLAKYHCAQPDVLYAHPVGDGYAVSRLRHLAAWLVMYRQRRKPHKAQK